MLFSKKNEIGREKDKKPSSPSLTIYRKNVKSQKTKMARISSKFNETIYSKSFIKTQKKSIFENFFPHKKPFLTFWVFPLLGGCFLASLTWSQNSTPRQKNFGFPNLIIPSNSDRTFEKTPLNTSRFFEYLRQSRANNKNTTDEFSFVGFYKKPTNQSFQNSTLSSSIENLCRFYLNLTNSCLMHSRKKNPMDQEDKIDFSTLADFPLLLQPNIGAESIWHSLKTSPDKLLINSSNKAILPMQSSFKFGIENKIFDQKNVDSFSQNTILQKIKNEDFQISNHKENSSFLLLTSFTRQEWRIPHILYLEASKLFDNWITKIAKNQTFHSLRYARVAKEKTDQTLIHNKRFILKSHVFNKNQQEVLEALDRLKNLNSKISNINSKTLKVKPKKNEDLTFYFTELLKAFQKNKDLLKQKASLFESVSSSQKLKAELPGFIDENIVYSSLLEDSLKNCGSSKLLLKQVQKEVKYNLVKTLFINRLIKKSINQEESGNPKKAMNAFLSTKPSKKLLTKNDTNNILRYTRLRESYKPAVFLETQAQKICEKAKFFNHLYKDENSILKSTNKELKKFVFELILLNSWKNVSPNLENRILNKIRDEKQKNNGSKMEESVYPFLKKETSILGTKQTNLQKSSKMMNKQRTDACLLLEPFASSFCLCKSTKKAQVHETLVYKRLKKISQALLDLSSFENLESLNEKKLASSPIHKSVKVFIYKTPFLMSDISPLRRDFFDGVMNTRPLDNKKITHKQRLNGVEKAFRRKLILWDESVVKPIEKTNGFVFKQLSIFNNLYLFDFVSNVQNIFKEVVQKCRKKTQILKFLDSCQTERYLSHIGLQKTVPHSFSIGKELTISKKGRIFLLKNSENKIGRSLKYKFKELRLKKIKNAYSCFPNVEKRKGEKIFRAYLSIKYPGNSVQKTTNWPSLLPILQKFKKARLLLVPFAKVSGQEKQESVQILRNFSNLSEVLFFNPDLIKMRKQAAIFKKAQKICIPSTAIFDNVGFNNNSTINKMGLKTLFSGKRQSLKKHLFSKPEQYLNRLIGYTHFLKVKELELNDLQIKRLEKKKSLEKRRRLKKLKLENRRRKKRKRFYPRPHRLRFELYNSFLQRRHSTELTNDFKNTKNENRFSQKVAQFKKNASIFKNKIFRQKREKWGNLKYDLFFDEKEQLKKLTFDWADPTYHQKEFYKISNETLTDFEHLCWKSYWLRSNLIPYVRRIQENLKKMKEIEVLKNSKVAFSTILNKLMLSTFPTIPNSCHISKSLMIDREKSKNNVGAYLNFKNTLDASNVTNPGTQNSKILENRAEYDRLLYERITDEIRNVKAQLNVDGQKQARSYKLGRKKPYQQKVKNTFSSFLFSGPTFLEPKIQPFLTKISNGNSSIKPLGEWPTLRLLWVCNKTNQWAFKETNFARELWSKYKIREQTKNNKTKKFLKKIFKIAGFASKNVETTSLNKVKQSLLKIEAFGNSIPFKNSKVYLTDLKNRIRDQKCLNIKKRSIATSNIEFESKWFDASLNCQSPKRMTHFWWSTRQENPIEKALYLWLLAPQQFFDFDYYLQNNTNSLAAISLLETVLPFSSNFILSSGFWFSCLLLHLSILFVIVRIPEIRSLWKFQLLILSKLGNSYVICLFNFYELIQNYKKRLKLLIQNSPSIALLQKTNLLAGSKTEPSLSEETEFSVIAPWLSFTHQKGSLFEEQSRSLFSQNFLQSTISYKFHFRSILDLNLQFEKNKGTLADSSKVLCYSINPYFGTQNVLDRKQPVKDFDKKAWFYSSLGFTWTVFSESQRTKKEGFQLILQQKKAHQKKSLNPALFSREKQKESSFNRAVQTKPIKFSRLAETNIQLQSLLALLVLNATRLFLTLSYYCLNSFYKLIYKIIDILESILLIFYKFFEKPAEVVVEWLADFFLVEFSSDITTYIPEAFDIALSNSAKKFSRSIRIPSGPLLGFVFQRTFLSSLENIYSWLLRPDADLLRRQKSGIVFWDVWAEILLQAAERYKMNLSSLSTIKEEQDLLIENLLQEKSSLAQKSQMKTLSTEQTTNFLNSRILKKSLIKMKPLMKFLDANPSENFHTSTSIINTCPIKVLNNPYRFFEQNQRSMDIQALTKRGFDGPESYQNTSHGDGWKRWCVNQYINMQGRDTDLFMDIHPPRSFSSIGFLNLYLSAQETLGTLVCDIYAGLFNKRVAKNILIIGAPGASKSIFVQALAGETELKIVIDNSNRYALVQGGVPVGMKLLREVFDSITMHTPCLFLLEDIHIIGERRPMLISDDESTRANETSFGPEQEEVHESNKLIYQSSRHSVSNYKKPYKGDFSLSIPTHYFCYDFFLGVPPSRKRRSELTSQSPLSVVDLEKAIESKDASNREIPKLIKQSFLSVLEISAKQLFAPPATSPFTVLLLKEQQKLKAKKVVNQLPWSGLSYEQSMLMTKSHYSVRSKVALLAEISMNNLSVKLDMITDLLVIIDSVRSNRGFVVFATTHLPSLLDPALRRPGRLDETLSLPILPNLNSRFQILKTCLASYQANFDCLDYSIFTGQMQESEVRLAATISERLLVLLNTKGTKKGCISISLEKNKHSIQPNVFNDFPIYSISQALGSISTLYLKKSVFKKSRQKLYSQKTNLPMLDKHPLDSSLLNNTISNVVSLVYGQAGQFIIESSLTKDLRVYTRKGVKPGPEDSSTEEQIFKILYNSSEQSNILLLKLLAGKFSEFFVFNNDFYNAFHRSQTSIEHRNSRPLNRTTSKTEKARFVPDRPFFRENLSKQYKTSIDLRRGWWLDADSLLRTNPSQFNRTESLRNFQSYWHSAASYIDSIIQKRYSVKKSSIISKLILFDDKSVLRPPLSPPKSSILMPARKFENYKRTLKDFFQQPMLTINEKLKLHQKQRFLKMLYKVSLKSGLETSDQKNKFKLDKTNKKIFDFSDSLKELGYLDLITLKPTASFCYYRNALLTRHRFSFLNQWWNGQLAEHNVETTYLSHVDWRSMFIESLGDISLDFPDAEHYYNPKSRRWFLNSKSWEYWQSFEKISRTEIVEHCLFSCFSKISTHLNENREFFDYLAFRFLRYHHLQEIDLLNFSVRFHKTSEIVIC